MGPLSEPVPERNQNKLYGIQFLEFVKKDRLSYKTYQAIVLIITFFAYASYHAARKTTSIVKSTLDPQSTEVGLKFIPWRITYLSEPEERRGFSWALGDGWTPFNGSDGTALLGDLDLAFLSIYAIAMYFSGHIGDRMDLRIFLTSTGWPSVVAVVGNWCGKSKRGLIMGIWNAHTSVGNISGSLIASAMLSYGWGWSFVVPGFLIAFIGLVVFLVLPVSPESVGIDRNEDELHYPKKTEEEVTEPLLGSDSKVKERQLDARAITAASFMYCAIPALFFYRSYGHISLVVNIALMFITGMFVNGPYALITTAVSADLGTHSSLKGNSRALATVTAIIDGTGSVGAAIGPLLTGYISEKSWSAVFTMLMGAALIAGLLLTRLVMAEVAAKIAESRPQTSAASRTPAVPQLDV
ncbi:hypothetical protein GH714_040335 [Hevea brasiliensis]|uniref:Major facilitator superfamily (MFS) profile domain-containing protein n=1 Tax=Hevea brasiliensis TaxID=3981 RepID=A0A6A6MS06_HEVBR|nr:hypothetical protein GH714_040335 [Hevea brasiliensis]